MTTEQELQNEIAGMWDDMRREGSMVADFSGNKVGMPWTAPFEGVCFPVEIDGDFSMVSIPADQVERFAHALLELIQPSKDADCEFEAFATAHEAIGKAKGV